MVGAAREGIRDGVLGSGLVLDVKVVFLQELLPSGLCTGQLWLCWEVSQSGVVSVNDKMRSIQVIALCFQWMHVSQDKIKLWLAR